MAVFVSRKKNRMSKKIQADDVGFFSSFLGRNLLRVPSAIFILAFIYIWSSSTTILSGNILHVCVSSRKLNNLYCLSAGTQPNLQIPASLNNDTSSSINEEVAEFGVKIDANSTSSFDNSVKTSSILAVGKPPENYTEVEEMLEVHRSWISESNNAECEGGGVYVYDLPSKFNTDLLAKCGEMLPWLNFCKYFSNGGLGEPIQALGKGWYDTHQYLLEPIFHSRVLNHPCRVYNHNEAKLFYVPYYGGLDVLRWHFKNVSNDAKDSMAVELLTWVQSQGPWYKNLGKDHIFVLGKITWDFRRKDESSWGTRLLELDGMQNPVKLLIERHPWHDNDIGIPHPTFFHPQTDDDVITWQLEVIKSKRSNVISFAGAARPNSHESIRSILIEQCTSSKKEECKVLNCTSGQCDRPETIVGLFKESEFCLQPPGDSATRKSIFDSLVSGCIPVLFDPMTAYYQYPWHLPKDHDKYSVFIDKEEVRNKSIDVVERLVRIPERERENMRRYIVFELLPGLVYGDLNSKFDKFQDAYSISINSLFKRVNRLNEVK